MAGWIKVESSTPYKPEVLQLSRILGVTRDDAFGKVVRFWMWLDSVTVDGRVDGVTSQDIDAIVGASGVAVAMRQVGWLEFEDGGQQISVNNFERHNGESAKARGLKTKRQAKWRAGRVDAGVDAPASPEKRREEVLQKEKKKHLHDLLSGTILDSPEFRDAWRLCCQHLGANADRGLNQAWEQATLAELARKGHDQALADVRFTLTIANARNVCDSAKPHPAPQGAKKAAVTAEDDFDQFVRANMAKGKR
jgi:hypothetical protein